VHNWITWTALKFENKYNDYQNQKQTTDFLSLVLNAITTIRLINKLNDESKLYCLKIHLLTRNLWRWSYIFHRQIENARKSQRIPKLVTIGNAINKLREKCIGRFMCVYIYIYIYIYTIETKKKNKMEIEVLRNE